MAESCIDCVYRDPEAFCIAIGYDCDTISSEDCDCYSPIMLPESDEDEREQ